MQFNLIFIRFQSIILDGLHVLTLELVLDNCKSDDVHFYIRLTERNNVCVSILHT